VLVCVLLSIRGHRWRELAAWGVGLAAYAAYFGWHWWMVQLQLTAADQAYGDGWIQFGGLGFILSTLHFNGLWGLGPSWIPALLLPLGILGLWAWPVGGRAFAMSMAYMAAFLVVGKPFNAYWGAVYAPVLMLGLGWVWPAVREAFDATPAD
jgi:hypothetical protein